MSILVPVPKCKECRYHSHNSFLRGSHFCTHSEIKKESLLLDQKQVPGRNMKTSPKWCPRRIGD